VIRFREDEAKDVFEEIDFSVNAEVRANLRSASIGGTSERAEVTPDAWSAMCQYINVLAERLPLLQDFIVRSRQISVEWSASVEDGV
jgi:hypothetical protein